MSAEQNDLFISPAAGLREGERRKDRGRKKVASRNEEFLRDAEAWAIKHSIAWGNISSDDVRLWAAREGRAPDHHNAWGNLFRSKGWHRVGYRPSTMPQAHARVIGIWRWSPPDDGKL